MIVSASAGASASDEFAASVESCKGDCRHTRNVRALRDSSENAESDSSDWTVYESSLCHYEEGAKMLGIVSCVL